MTMQTIPMQHNRAIPWLTSDYTTSTRTITPEIARVILESHNNRNRRMDPKTVSRWRRAMERGEWRRNGESISFDRNLDVVDGQHRLQACLISGRSFDTAVVTGLDPEEARHTVDIGKGRSQGDILQMSGIEAGILVAATVRALHRIRGGHREGTSTRSRYDEQADIQDPAHVERIALAEMSRIREAIRSVAGISTKWIASGSAAALHVEFQHLGGVDLANEFWSAVKTGASLDGSDPRLALRNRLASAADSLRQGRAVSTHGSLLNRADLRERLVIHAWNRWVEGKPAVERGGTFTASLGRKDGDKTSAYPTIQGVVA